MQSDGPIQSSTIFPKCDKCGVEQQFIKTREEWGFRCPMCWPAVGSSCNTRPEIKIVSVSVIKNVGADKVYIHTDLPTPMPFLTKQNLTLYFEVEKDKGEGYVKKNFGMSPTVTGD